MDRKLVAAAAASVAALGAWLARRYLSEREAAEASAEARRLVESGGTLRVRLTGYWPFTATEAERRMEGGVRDRRGRPLHTLEMHQKDPVAHPYVSVSGDDAVFPYGQALLIDQWPGVLFRVVDTGGNFRGAGKVYREPPLEPLDVCVESKRTPIRPHAVATILRGDHLDKPGREVAAGRLRQALVGAGECVEGPEAPARSADLEELG